MGHTEEPARWLGPAGRAPGSHNLVGNLDAAVSGSLLCSPSVGGREFADSCLWCGFGQCPVPRT